MSNANARLEAFCDGVFAIAITLLILDIKVPAAQTTSGPAQLWIKLWEAWPYWFAYISSFGAILIAWVNHHHTMKLFKATSPRFLFANGLLLFTVSIMPYTTALVAEYINTNSAQPAILFYCFNRILHNIAWNIIFATGQPLLDTEDENKTKAFHTARKRSEMSFFIYLVITIITYWLPVTGFILMNLTWIMWLIIGTRTISTKEQG